MKKYVKPFLLVILNNSFLLMFFLMLKNWIHWGVMPILIIGLSDCFIF